VICAVAVYFHIRPHEVAGYPFRYYMAIRNEMLLKLHREAAAMREAQDESSGTVDVDRAHGIK
jgi:hypothetical protein